MPEQRSTILDLLYDVIRVTVNDFVRDIVLSAKLYPVRVKTGPTVVNSKHCIDHTSLVFLVFLVSLAKTVIQTAARLPQPSQTL